MIFAISARCARDRAARRLVVEKLRARHARLDVFGLRPKQLGAGDERAVRIDAVEHRAGKPSPRSMPNVEPNANSRSA